MSRPNVLERVSQTRRLLRSEGYTGVSSRLLSRASRWLSPTGGERLKVARRDLVRAGEIASTGWRLPAPLPLVADEPLKVAWVCVPPGAGAGGFTTMYRLASSLRARGQSLHRLPGRSPRLVAGAASQDDPGMVAFATSRDPQYRGRFAGCPRDLCDLLGNRLHRPDDPRQGHALLSGPKISSRHSIQREASLCSPKPPIASAFTV